MVNGKVLPVLIKFERTASIALQFLTSTLDRCEWSARRLCPFNPEEMTTGTHLLRGYVGPRADLNAREKVDPNRCQLNLVHIAG
jgi:hypothetical protein